MYQDKNKNKNIKINKQKRQRVIDIANYILQTRSTIRDAAKHFRISKSTVHVDMSVRLKMINPELHKEVEKLLDYHKDVRHIRGGEATRKKYQKVG